jgi:hypothetical protein
MKLTTIKEGSKSGSAAKTLRLLRSSVLELRQFAFHDRKLMTRLADIPRTQVGNGFSAYSDGSVVTQCTHEKNVDATVTRTTDNLTAINAIYT